MYKWIPVSSKKLPKPQKIGDKDYSETVFVTVKNGQYTETLNLGHYCYSMKKWFTKDSMFGEVIAWMPLPKAYREVEE